MSVFADRHDAGRRLAEHVLAAAVDEPAVVGLACGGAVVAAEVAQALGAPLDALAVRKVRHPAEPEYALGAVAPGVTFLRPDVDVPIGAIDAAVAAAAAQAERLDRYLHEQAATLDLSTRTCVLVDDGLATGATMAAAIRWARIRGAARVVVAVPVGPSETLRAFEREANVVVAVDAPETIRAVGEWYADFGEVSTAEVVELLRTARSGAAVPVTIAAGVAELEGELRLPDGSLGAVVFAHGSGSSRHSPRTVAVARQLHAANLGTLLVDLLTGVEAGYRARVFEIDLLAERLRAATLALRDRTDLPVAYFGASTGAAAALRAAAEDAAIRAVVSRGGRPDLAGPALGALRAPTLLIVGGADETVLSLNRRAMTQMRCPVALEVIPGATHLFAEPGALDRVADLAIGWFQRHLAASEI